MELHQGQTQTKYDEAYTPVNNSAPGQPNGDFIQKNLRNRVGYTLYIPDFSLITGAAPFQSATYYSYDTRGNVNDLLQDYLGLAKLNEALQRHKCIQYYYDLVSGKVNEVHYQHQSADAFYHRYGYDAENRLVKVETSRDRIYWETDARYEYYRHGPLARTLLGQLGVQGIDYAYTLQGWLKGINGNGIGDPTLDMGLDGWNNLTSNPQKSLNARDVLNFSLHYYEGDYKKIGTTYAGHNNINPAIWNAVGSNNQLFNGNIAAMVTDNQKLGNALAYRYRYDQLNRITAMDAFGQPFGIPTLLQDYKERISYDPNGNILTYERNGAQSDRGLAMDNLAYHYMVESGLPINKLKYVKENDTNNFYVEDLKDQPLDNYVYDKIGNLIEDKQAGISNISWTVYGKIEKISKTDGSNLAYTYDASGNRIEKIYYKGASIAAAGEQVHYTWYVRDAQGNTMAVYEKKGSTAVRHTETHLYGSSRIGIVKELTKTPVNVATSPILLKKHTFTRGEKFFELTNHLGNVLAVIADKKIPVAAVAGTAVNYFMADVVNATDYYPFGMPMPGRNGIAYQSNWVPGRGFVAGSSYPDYLQISSRPYAPTPDAYRAGKEVELLPGFETATGTDELLVEIQPGSGVLSNDYPGGQGSYEAYGYYRYGFNGKENDNEVKGAGNQQDYGMRIYDPRVGRFLSVDPLTPDYPSWSPYPFAMNRPIDGIDLDGCEWQPVNATGENVPVGSKETSDYRWAGFGLDGKGAQGTVASATLQHGNSTHKFNSTFDQTTRRGTGSLDISDNKGNSLNAFIFGDNTAQWSQTSNGKTSEASMYQDRHYQGMPGSPGGTLVDRDVRGFTGLDFSLKRASNPVWHGWNPEAIESDGLGPVEFFIGIGELKAVKSGISGLGTLMRGGLDFKSYKLARGGGQLLGEIDLMAPHPFYGSSFPVRVEFHHRFISQAAQRNYKLPNWMVNNWINVQKTNTLRHASVDAMRYRFLPREIKSRLGPGGDLSSGMFD